MDFEAFRARMERAFGADFAAVELNSSGAAESATQSIGAVAAARDQTIFLSRSFFAQSLKRQEFILAHEFGHIAQKRAGKIEQKARFPDRIREALIEVDANLAAADALAGRRARCVLADKPERMARWEEAGHYYTTLLFMLMNGVDKKTSLRRAFFCQMPDEVYEFDAVAAGADYAQDTVPGSLAISLLGLKPATETIQTKTVRFHSHDEFGFPSEYDQKVETPDSKARRHQLDHEVQVGLHCLVGSVINNPDVEVDFRSKVLKSIEASDDLTFDLTFGLALHAFGDSFAHVDAKAHNYPEPLGHAFDTKLGDLLKNIPLLGSQFYNIRSPDNIYQHGSAYDTYLWALDDILGKPNHYKDEKWTSKNLKIILKLWNLIDIQCSEDTKLCKDKENEMAKKKNEYYCDYIRNIIIENGFLTSGELEYAPEKIEGTYWARFQKQHIDMIPNSESENVLLTVRKHAQEWALHASQK